MLEMAENLGVVLKFLMDHKADENTMKAFDKIRSFITTDLWAALQRTMVETEIQ